MSTRRERSGDRCTPRSAARSTLLFLGRGGLLGEPLFERLFKRRGIGVELTGIDEWIGRTIGERGALVSHPVHFRMRREQDVDLHVPGSRERLFVIIDDAGISRAADEAVQRHGSAAKYQDRA